jgi:hypothetical protein
MRVMMTQNTIPENALFLVAVLPSRRDFEIARLLGWYRIPIRSAPKVVDVDYLAFYQTAAFGKEHAWQVEYYAAVKGHELTRRADLFREEKDHPRANEEYYKVQLGPLQNLPQPILAEQWRRLTFLYTTGVHMATARTLRDLVVGSTERTLLWQALRERAAQADKYLAGGMDELTEEAVQTFFGLLADGESSLFPESEDAGWDDYPKNEG